MEAKRPGLLILIPPPLWLLMLLLASYAVTAIFGLPPILRSDVAAIVLAVAGIALAVWGAGTFAGAGTELEPASETNKKLVTHGPFRFTRNPMYSGVLLVSLGVAFFFGTLPFYFAVIVMFLLVNSVFIPFEEAKMERQFGAGFRDYKSRVRRWGIF